MLLLVPQVSKWRNGGCCGVSILFGECGRMGGPSTRLKSVGAWVGVFERVMLLRVAVPAHAVEASFGHVFVCFDDIDSVFLG